MLLDPALITGKVIGNLESLNMRYFITGSLASTIRRFDHPEGSTIPAATDVTGQEIHHLYKAPIPGGLRVDLEGFEPSASSVRLKRAGYP